MAVTVTAAGTVATTAEAVVATTESIAEIEMIEDVIIIAIATIETGPRIEAATIEGMIDLIVAVATIEGMIVRLMIVPAMTVLATMITERLHMEPVLIDITSHMYPVAVILLMVPGHRHLDMNLQLQLLLRITAVALHHRLHEIIMGMIDMIALRIKCT